MDVSRFLKVSFSFDLYINWLPNQETIDYVKRVNGLVKLCISQAAFFRYSLSAFVNLEDICITRASQINDLETMATNLINLKQIYFLQASINQIMVFITQSVTLKRIKIKNLRIGLNKVEVIDLIELNKARERLERAQKITILVMNDLHCKYWHLTHNSTRTEREGVSEKFIALKSFCESKLKWKSICQK